MEDQKQTPESVPDTQPVDQTKTEVKVESKDWFQQFREAAGEDARYLDKYKDADSAKKGILSAFQMVGKKGDIPKDDAPDTERAEFWNKLGADKIDIKIPEFGDEYGDLKGQLGEYYSGVANEIVEIAKDVIPKSKGINDAIAAIVSEFAKRDGERTLKSQVESTRMTEENIAGTAKKLGLSVDELKRANQEVIDRFGWNDKTSFAEVLQELHKATFNSPVMQQAYMNNTNEGLRLQMEELKTDPDWGTDTAKGRQLVQRRIELLDKMGQLSQKK